MAFILNLVLWVYAVKENSLFGFFLFCDSLLTLLSICSCVDRKSSDLGLGGVRREYLQTDCAINEVRILVIFSFLFNKLCASIICSRTFLYSFVG